jgi:cyclophilin family peptidyl-prolyl cis-trans isomerase
MRGGSATEVPPYFCTMRVTSAAQNNNAATALAQAWRNRPSPVEARLIIRPFLCVDSIAVASNKRARQKAKRRERLLQEARRRRRRRLIAQATGFLAAAVIVVLVLALVNTFSGSKPAWAALCPAGFYTANRVTHFDSPPPVKIDPKKTYYAIFRTDVGTVKVRLLFSLAPRTVNNFVFLACHHFYDSTYFHRVVTNFVDQGGDPTGTGSGGPGYTIPDEYPTGAKKVTAPYAPGDLAMANTGAPNSGGSQFFFVASPAGASQLNQLYENHQGSYTIFGKVVSGLQVIERINKDGSASSEGIPRVRHRLLSVTLASH